MKKLFVISLGGSLIVPNRINTTFLEQFKNLILKQIKKGHRFVIICGGGALARTFQKEAKKLKGVKDVDLDWIGIHATKMNAQVVKSLFGDKVEDKILDEPKKKIPFKRSILIASGWIPGWSTDYDAVLLAKTYGTSVVVNMSNIDYVYSKDPKKYKNAQKIRYLSWKHYRLMVGDTWKPGFNSPFDPIAAKLAQRENISAVVIGKNLANLENVLDDKGFKGTVIK